MELVKNLVDPARYGLKCPYEMIPSGIVIHNTANDASAANEIAYMRSNDNEVSFHYAVDGEQVVQGIPENRNAWHAGDGNGRGNRAGIGIEICYSKSGGEPFARAEKNCAAFVAELLTRYGWGIERVGKHQDYDGKYCPHRTLDLGWERFLELVEDVLESAAQEEPVDWLGEVLEGDGQNLRKTPNGAVLRVLPLGTKVGICAKQGEWGRTVGEEAGWLYLPILSVSEGQEAPEEREFQRFCSMLARVGKERQQMGESRWSQLEGGWSSACRQRIFDGTMPREPVTREQLAAVIFRMGLLPE